MKKLLLAVILILTQTTLGVEARRMTTAEAAARVDRSYTYKEIVKARESGNELTSDARLMEKINKMLDLSLKDLVNFSIIEKTGLIRLINANAKDALTEVARLSSIARDSTSSVQEKERAKKSLELLVMASHTVDSLVVNSEQAQLQKEAVTKIIEISEKISSLNFGPASKAFVEQYEKALAGGKSIEQAILEASNNRFNEKELRECVL